MGDDGREWSSVFALCPTLARLDEFSFVCLSAAPGPATAVIRKGMHVWPTAIHSPKSK